jgi:hypothetical protein
MKRFLTALIIVVSFLVLTISVWAASLTLDPSADGHFTAAWTGTFADVDDGATPDDDAAFATVVNTSNARESYHVPNVTSTEVPDGSTINFVEIQTRVRVTSSTGTFVHGIYKGTLAGDISEDTSSDTATTSYQEFTHQMTTDPFTGSAWAVATLRNWQSGGSVPRSFGVKSMAGNRTYRLTRMRILIDFTAPARSPQQLLLGIGES